MLLPRPVAKEMDEAKTELMEYALRKWQEDWKNSERGAWTKELLPTVSTVETEALTFYLAQALSGHGVFASYLYKYKCRRSPWCQCGQEIENPEHVFRTCERCANGRPQELDGRKEETLNILKQ